jgi:hypothetical protein
LKLDVSRLQQIRGCVAFLAAAGVAPLGGAGCYVGLSEELGGNGSMGASAGDDGEDGHDDDENPATQCNDPSAANGRLRRLTRVEYDNTVRDLLGDTSAPASSFPIDERIGHFDSNWLAPVGTLGVENYMNVAMALAANAVEHLDDFVDCDPAELGGTACAEQFIERFGRRVFRRPLDASERAAFVQLFQSQSDEGFAAGIELVLGTMLQSPHFLYRPEFGVAAPDTSEVLALTGYEIAARLSYFLWASTPDEVLLDAAEHGELDDLDGVVSRARAMLDDPRFEDAVSSFTHQWLGTEHVQSFGKDPVLFPEFAGLSASFYAETDAFVRAAFRRPDGSLRELLTADYTYGDEALAAFYGVAHPDGEGGIAELALDPEQRAGFLTQPAVLAVHARENQTSPILRGAFVRERLLCHSIPPPPPDVNDVPPDPDPNSTARERFEQHTADPSCAGCHNLLDPIGFGFERYDAIGRFRTEEANKSIDATGQLLATRDIDGPFDGAVELAHRLAGSEQVSDCFASLYVEFALGRVPREADECSVDAVLDHFSASGGNLRELVIAVVASDAFRFHGVPQ